MIHLIKSKMEANKENRKLTPEREVELRFTNHIVIMVGILLGRG